MTLDACVLNYDSTSGYTNNGHRWVQSIFGAGPQFLDSLFKQILHAQPMSPL